MPIYHGPNGEKAIFSGPEDAIPEGWTLELPKPKPAHRPKHDPTPHKRKAR